MARRAAPHPVVLTTLLAVLFAGWLGALGVAPARAQVDVSAPTEAQARAVGTWYQQHVPARFRARRVVPVTLLDDREMTSYLGDGTGPGDDSSQADGGGIDGVFENDPPRITLRLPPSGEPDLPTFAHEYGHYVWFALLGKEDRRRYAALYDRQRAAHHLVSGYAEDCLEEGFAEAFSFFLCQPSLLARRDPLSSQFLWQWGGK